MDNILEYKGYQAEIHFSAPDQCLVGKILNLSDLVVFEGKSVKDIISAFEKAVQDYEETCKEISLNK